MIKICDECGFRYSDSYNKDVKTHKELHEKYLLAKEKYGYCWTAQDGEAIKNESQNIRRVLKPQFEVIDTRNNGDPEEVLELFVAVTNLKDFEAFDASVDMLNANPVFGQENVERILPLGQLSAARLFERG